MTLLPIVNGEPVSENQNSLPKAALRQAGRNSVRQAVDRLITTQDNEYVEAYVTSGGRFSTVENTGPTTSLFNTDKYEGLQSTTNSSLTTHDPDSVTNPENFFDGNDGSYASYSITSAAPSYTKQLGKTFSSRFVSRVKLYITGGATSSSGTAVWTLQTYNGSTWSDYLQLLNASGPGGISTYNQTISLNITTQGLRVKAVHNYGPAGSIESYIRWHVFQIYEAISTVVSHRIPNNKFNTPISTVGIFPFVEDWEPGDDIEVNLIEYQGNGSSTTETLTSDTTQTATTEPRGVQISRNLNCVIISVTKNSSCTATRALYYNGNGTTRYLIATATFSGNVATFDTPIRKSDFANDTILLDNSGDSYIPTRKSQTFTVSGTNINYTTGQIGFTTDGTYSWNIDSLTTQPVQNGSESGFISIGRNGNVISFTELNNIGTVVIKLIPTSTMPEPGFPSINGISIIG